MNIKEQMENRILFRLLQNAPCPHCGEFCHYQWSEDEDGLEEVYSCDICRALTAQETHGSGSMTLGTGIVE